MFNVLNKYVKKSSPPPHPELTRERWIRFLLFEIKCILVYNSTLFNRRGLSALYFLFQSVYVNKKVYKEDKIFMLDKSNCVRKAQLN